MPFCVCIISLKGKTITDVDIIRTACDLVSAFLYRLFFFSVSLPGRLRFSSLNISKKNKKKAEKKHNRSAMPATLVFPWDMGQGKSRLLIPPCT